MTGDEGQGPGSDAGPLSLSPEGATATSRAIASGRHYRVGTPPRGLR
jgi:hypothetical protein